MDDPRRLRIFHAVGSDGQKVPLFLSGWKEGRAHLSSNGSAAYLADPKTGLCEGIDSMVGTTLQLCYAAHRRLQMIERIRRGPGPFAFPKEKL